MEIVDGPAVDAGLGAILERLGRVRCGRRGAGASARGLLVR
jgi:hypothetical protein